MTTGMDFEKIMALAKARKEQALKGEEVTVGNDEALKRTALEQPQNNNANGSNVTEQGQGQQVCMYVYIYVCICYMLYVCMYACIKIKKGASIERRRK